MWRYKLLLLLLFIPLVIYTLWQSLRASELRYFLQRFSILFSGKVKPNGMWIQAASVGEVNAVIPLILKIHENKPEITITLTTNTLTGAGVAKKLLPTNIKHYYFPLDYLWAQKRIINKIKPKNIFIVETEFWPNLYVLAHKKHIPLFIINGRISEKTLYAKDWLKDIYAQILPLVTNVYARSETDQSRFITLGLPEDKTEVLGNIKFSTLEDKKTTAIDLGRPYVLAASTREDEEKIIVEAWLKADHNDHLLVIVPRHPKRLSDILNQLKSFDVGIAIRSNQQTPNIKDKIYIADTIGELKQFIAGSEFVLMGGSFVAKGGHNILEVAQQGKAVIFGTDMRNFEDEVKIFHKYNAGIQSTNNELLSLFNKFLTNKEYRATFEKNALKLTLENNNTEKYYNKILSNG